MFDFTKYDFIIFDCDGVILNSNSLKSQAFKEALSNEPEGSVEKFVEYHKLHGGVSRYKKFRHYFEKIKKSNQSEKESISALKRFAEIVKNGMVECSYINGIEDFLKKSKEYGLQLFVVSGSDEKELKEVFYLRGILDYFSHVCGSPTNKIDNTQKVIDVMGLNRKGIFFGDSKTDYDAAKKFGIKFVFVKGVSEWSDGTKWNKDRGNLVINNFLEF